MTTTLTSLSRPPSLSLSLSTAPPQRNRKDALPRPAFPRLPAPRSGPRACSGAAPPQRCCPLLPGGADLPRRRLLPREQRPRRGGGGGGGRRGRGGRVARPPGKRRARPAPPEPSSGTRAAVARRPPGQLDVGLSRRDEAQVRSFEEGGKGGSCRLFSCFFFARSHLYFSSPSNSAQINNTPGGRGAGKLTYGMKRG